MPRHFSCHFGRLGIKITCKFKNLQAVIGDIGLSFLPVICYQFQLVTMRRHNLFKFSAKVLQKIDIRKCYVDFFIKYLSPLAIRPFAFTGTFTRTNDKDILS